MATKEQELKALEKIKKIVEELGEDSYIGMALDGCFEIAEDNINNDFACSMKQRWQSAEKETENKAAQNNKNSKQYTLIFIYLSLTVQNYGIISLIISLILL